MLIDDGEYYMTIILLIQNLSQSIQNTVTRISTTKHQDCRMKLCASSFTIFTKFLQISFYSNKKKSYNHLCFLMLDYWRIEYCFLIQGLGIKGLFIFVGPAL